MHSIFYDATCPTRFVAAIFFKANCTCIHRDPSRSSSATSRMTWPEKPLRLTSHAKLSTIYRWTNSREPWLILSQDSFIIRSANDYFLNFFGNWAVISAKPISTSLVCAHPQATIS